MAKDKIFKFNKAKIVLKCEEKQDKGFDYYCNTIKKDAYSMPSKFVAGTVYYPATKLDTQTYYTQIVADLYRGTDLLDTLKLSDEFDTRRAAEKWIFQVFREMFLDILEEA
ncbi:MAG: hypothetical protein K2M48_00040 [Clostridiales bacterium]|nr:hypothetical protein [Clostridiales bacterium]